MKTKMLLAAAAVSLLWACSPEVYSFYLDVRKPSLSGMDLSKKSIAIAYMEGPAQTDSLLSANTASLFAQALEEDYFGGEQVIGMYAYPVADSVSVEAMRNLVMDTGEDVVFLLKTAMDKPVDGVNNPITRPSHPDSANVFTAKVPIDVKLYAYDSMGEDKVQSWKGTTFMKAAVYNNGITPQENLEDLILGLVPGFAPESLEERISPRFKSTWKTESFSFYWFDDFNSERWLDGIGNAAQGKFADAIKSFEPFLKSKSIVKQAHACYNIAMCFYMLEDMELATKWLDMAERMENISQAPTLRKRIAAKLAKVKEN
ncbi:MAG: tetratricopeptide repeat protein [Bacteroidales bacterium]|nr:tetratricopeptide repeat protein [Bacteroidales bacterium]